MDPAAMRAAMEAMQKLPPDQLQRMMAGMGNISPDMMSQAQQMASRMSPEDWQRASEQIGSMNASDLERQAAAASTQFSAQQKYVLSASQQQKNEGNQLLHAGKFAEAIDKYERAKQNVASHTGSEAAELRRACTLNLSMCYLKLSDWGSCIAQCNDVLASEPDNLKALYRRGQAYMGISGWAQAVEDLTKALKLSAGDPTQQQLIRDKLQESKDQLSSQRAAAALQQGLAAASSEAAQPAEPSSTADVPRATAGAPHATSTPASPSTIPAGPSNTSSSSTGPAAGASPHLDPNMLQAAAEHMRNNPDWAKQVEGMMKGMSDEQLRELSRSMGAEVTREQLSSVDWAQGLTADQVDKVARFQQRLQQDGDVVARLRANPRDPEAIAATTQMMQDNPEMVSTMADMLEKMSPDQLEAMARQSGLPTQSISADMIKTAASMFKNMKPDELKAMTEMAAKMQPPNASSFPTSSNSAPAAAAAAAAAARSSPAVEPSSSQAGPAAAAAAPSSQGSGSASGTGSAAGGPMAMPPGMPPITPDMAKMAAEMMSSLSPEQLQAMTGARGMPGMTPEMAKMAADMMAKMSPEDMQQMAAMMGQPGAAGMSGGPAGAGFPGMAGGMPGADMLSRMDPKMMDSALSMMRGMDTPALASMLLSSGMVKSQAQAEAMAGQLKNMSDTQVKMMAKAAQVVQSGAQAVRKTKEFVGSRLALFVAIGILLLAVLLRWLGWM